VSSGFSGLINDQRSARRLDLRQDFLKRLELEVAVRAPAAAIDGHDDRTLLPQRADVDDLLLRIAQHELRRAIADLQHCPSDDTGAQLLDVTLHDRLTISRHALAPVGTVFGELFFEGHCATSSCSNRAPARLTGPKLKAA
jgi:hypothetical protein